MQKLRTILIILALAAGSFSSSYAQEAGLFNSPKGIGAQYRFPVKDGIFHTATGFVDIYGIPTSRCLYPGYRFNFSRQYVISELESNGLRYLFYLGPGVSFGYVRDHDKGRGIDLTSLMSDNPGFMLALSAGTGCRIDFGGRIALDLSFSAEGGVHVRRNEKEKGYTAASLSVYNNGFMQAWYPQLTILFKL